MMSPGLHRLRKPLAIATHYSNQRSISGMWIIKRDSKCCETRMLTNTPKSFHRHPFIRGISSQNQSDVKWLHPAQPEAELREAGNKHNTWLEFFGITLQATEPVSGDRVEKALHHLPRKLPFLRACLREYKSQLWVCEMTNPKLDFKVVEGGDWRKETTKLLHRGFDSHTGPLWRIRFMPLTDMPSHVPYGANSHHHHYKLLITFHIGLFRGTMVFPMIKLLLDLLNGKVVDDTDIGRYMSEEEILDFERLKDKCRETHPLHLKAEVESRLALHHQPLLAQAFQVPSGSGDVFHFEQNEINLETSKKIFNKCRSEGVTVNSFMSAVINTAMVNMAKDAGIKKENYDIVCSHDIDARRYMTGDVSNLQNSPILKMAYLKSTPSNVFVNFWEYARQLNTELHYRLTQMHPVYENTVDTDRRPSNFTYDGYFHDRKPNSDYSFSNIGKAIEFSEDSPIRIVRLELAESIIKLGLQCRISMYTFQDRLNLSLGYATKFITQDTIHKLQRNISEVIEAIIR